MDSDSESDSNVQVGQPVVEVRGNNQDIQVGKPVKKLQRPVIPRRLKLKVQKPPQSENPAQEPFPQPRLRFRAIPVMAHLTQQRVPVYPMEPAPAYPTKVQPQGSPLSSIPDELPDEEQQRTVIQVDQQVPLQEPGQPIAYACKELNCENDATFICEKCVKHLCADHKVDMKRDTPKQRGHEIIYETDILCEECSIIESDSRCQERCLSICVGLLTMFLLFLLFWEFYF